MTDIAELFARDPLSHTDEDIEAIITEFRKSRQKFTLGFKQAGNTKPKTEKQKQVAAISETLGLEIDL